MTQNIITPERLSVPDRTISKDPFEEAPNYPMKDSFSEPSDPTKEKRTWCAGLLFVTDRGEVLLLKRSKKSSFPGFWDLPGGHIKVDPSGRKEPLWSAAIRETEEEIGGIPLGLLKRVNESREKSNLKSHNDYEGKLFYKAWIIKIPHNPWRFKWVPNLSWEHSDYKWFDLHFLPSNVNPALPSLVSDLL